MEDVTISVQPLRDGIYMLKGQGGNIGLSVGSDATFIVDDQFAPLTDKIVAAISGVSDRPVDYVINTHWHYDHTGGNENFGKRGALIMAHDNVHPRMRAGATLGSGRVVEPAPDIALPVVTFRDRLTLTVNNQTVRGVHVPTAHTDGDVIVFFEEANVLHMGDTFFNGAYPYVDLSSGGNYDGIVYAAKQALELCDADTLIIPGHGPLATRDDLQQYLDMLVKIRRNVVALQRQGLDRDAVIAAKPTAEFDSQVNADGFIKPDVLVGFIIDSLYAFTK